MQPGFKGAVLQAQLQEFHDNHIKDGIGVKMNLEEIRKAYKEGNYNILDIVDRADVEQLDFVKGFKEASKRLYDKLQTKETEFAKADKLKADYEAKITEKDTEITKYKNADIKRDSVKVLDTILKERTTLDEKQVKFIRLGYPNYTITDHDKVKDELNKFADNKLEEYKKVSEALGIVIDNPDNDKDKTPGAKPFKTSSAGKIEYDDKGLIKGDNPFIVNPKK